MARVDGVNRVGMPGYVVAGVDGGDVLHCLWEVEVGVEGRVEFLAVGRGGAVEGWGRGWLEGPVTGGEVGVCRLELWGVGGWIEEGPEEEVGC